MRIHTCIHFALQALIIMALSPSAWPTLKEDLSVKTSRSTSVKAPDYSPPKRISLRAKTVAEPHETHIFLKYIRKYKSSEAFFPGILVNDTDRTLWQQGSNKSISLVYTGLGSKIDEHPFQPFSDKECLTIIAGDVLHKLNYYVQTRQSLIERIHFEGNKIWGRSVDGILNPERDAKPIFCYGGFHRPDDLDCQQIFFGLGLSNGSFGAAFQTTAYWEHYHIFPPHSGYVFGDYKIIFVDLPYDYKAPNFIRSINAGELKTQVDCPEGIALYRSIGHSYAQVFYHFDIIFERYGITQKFPLFTQALEKMQNYADLSSHLNKEVIPALHLLSCYLDLQAREEISELPLRLPFLEELALRAKRGRSDSPPRNRDTYYEQGKQIIAECVEGYYEGREALFEGDISLRRLSQTIGAVGIDCVVGLNKGLDFATLGTWSGFWDKVDQSLDNVNTKVRRSVRALTDDVTLSQNVGDYATLGVGAAIGFLNPTKMSSLFSKVKTLKSLKRLADSPLELEGKIDKWSRAPKSIQDQMTLGAAMRGEGAPAFKKENKTLDDSRYKGMVKMRYSEKADSGKQSVVHYVKDPKTGDLMDFKFKKHSTDDKPIDFKKNKD